MNRLSIQNRNIRVKNNTLYYRPNWHLQNSYRIHISHQHIKHSPS
jgi:hypothetical protein